MIPITSQKEVSEEDRSNGIYKGLLQSLGIPTRSIILPMPIKL